MEKIADAASAVRDLPGRVPQDSLAREVQVRTAGAWVCWYGHATGDYWAIRRAPYPWLVWVWDSTPAGLEARITDVDARLGPRRRP